MKTGVELIKQERKRQIEKEGWSLKHDQIHADGQLAIAASVYADIENNHKWPWDKESFKPTPNDRIKELTKAGALIAAEIDRLLSVEMEAMSSVERRVVEIKQDRKKHPIKWMWKDFKWWLIPSINWVRIKLAKKQEKKG